MESTDPYGKHSLRTSMYFPETHLMVAGNPKAAGTTLRWWLLSAHGVDVSERTRRSWWGASAPYQTVWDEGVQLDYVWPQTLILAGMSALLLAAAARAFNPRLE